MRIVTLILLYSAHIVYGDSAPCEYNGTCGDPNWGRPPEDSGGGGSTRDPGGGGLIWVDAGNDSNGSETGGDGSTGEEPGGDHMPPEACSP